MSETPNLRRWANGARPYFFDDPDVDRLVAMLMALTGEVSVLRDRLDTLERLLEARGGPGPGDIEAYVPSEGVAAERARQREQLLAEVLRIVEAEREALAEPGSDAPYDRAIELVEKG